MADLINIINFDLGPVRATIGVIDAWRSRGLDPREEGFKLIARHWTGDWGDLPDETKAINDHALASGDGIVSRYLLEAGFTVYITTEANRSATIILLASERSE